MTFRATGPGRIEINPRYTGAGILTALLYNFDFDDMSVVKLKNEEDNLVIGCDTSVIHLAGDSSR